MPEKIDLINGCRQAISIKSSSPSIRCMSSVMGIDLGILSGRVTRMDGCSAFYQNEESITKMDGGKALGYFSIPHISIVATLLGTKLIKTNGL
jgi:hypothetical protein